MKTYLLDKTISLWASILLMLVFAINSNAHFGSKGPFGGTVTCSITAADTVFIGTAEGGVFSSTSPLLVGWRARVVGLKSGKITALAHNGTDLFAATADSGIYIWNGYDGSDRYFKKINIGLTNLNVTSLIAINSTTLMAGTTDGIFLSENKGASWTPVNGSLHHLDVTSIVKAGTRIFITTDEGGVYATDDNGTTWVDFNDLNTEHIAGTHELSYNATTDELMVLNENGLFVATSASTATVPAYTLVMTGLQASYKIEDISNNATSWFVATDHGVFTSTVGTIAWSSLNTGLSTLETTTIEPFKTGLVVGSINKGIFKATLPFTSWSQINAGYNNLKTTAMVTSGVAFVVAATENGVYVSKDLAANYVSANKGLNDSLNVTDLIMADFCVLAATKNLGIFFSADSGKNWVEVNNGLMNLSIKKLFYSNNKKYAICSAGNIYISDMHSSDWTMIQSGLPGGVIPTSMEFYGNNVLLGTYGDGVFIKKTYSTQWTAYNTGLTNLNVTSVTSLGTKIYAGTDGAGVFVSDSTTTAISWIATAPTSITQTSRLGLDGTKIQAMAAYGGYVWASYRGGLLASSDQGVTWIAGGNQFNLPSYTDVTKITFVTTRVFVSTENNGLYSNALTELPTITTGIFTASSTTNTLVGVAPNPNNGSFKLNVDQISGAVTEIAIFDTVGNLKGVFDGSQSTFNLNYAAGMYVLFVKTNTDSVYTQKIVIE